MIVSTVYAQRRTQACQVAAAMNRKDNIIPHSVYEDIDLIYYILSIMTTTHPHWKNALETNYCREANYLIMGPELTYVT